MIFKIKDLEEIRNGHITLAFRKWKRPSVVKGTLLNTPIGQLEVLGIQKMEISGIKEEMARLAGFDNLQQLTELLAKRTHGEIYKVSIKYHSPDPRIALRNRDRLTAQEFNTIREKLNRYDSFSKQGPWTIGFLEMIESNPKVRAKDLSNKINKDKDWLKVNVRKLKNMGLTISHEVGYSLSPRGWAFLNRLRKEEG